ncbi:C39 family peptidase [Neobacillus kokaensis]|uniref:Peptidase C39 n=1 Tax=Neobacillus kokaensis TaxID=2759023 RepID=A0ABQ3NBV8_9BACI|nr:C39 family peptidase [Neobacillus kokaensis]GHI01413.1 peptidase C39 [Neobacillus kokaensis]
MKRLSILALILPMLGCSQINDDKKTSTMQIRNSTQSNFELTKETEVNSKQKKTSNTELNAQIIKTANKYKSSKTENGQKRKDSALLDVVLIKQNPELKYGCEVTSLTMMLKYAGVKTNKIELYQMIKKDPDPLIKSAKGDILRWGNPADGFVGDMTGKRPGYAVYDKPMIDLINKKLPGRAVNLTNQPFDRVLAHVSAGYPVVIWTTGDYRLPDRPEGWYHGKHYIKTPLDLHVVLLVGYDANYVYLNDPLSGRKQVRVGKKRFISSWEALKRRAVSYK